jgi:hypothetical protein
MGRWFIGKIPLDMEIDNVIDNAPKHYGGLSSTFQYSTIPLFPACLACARATRLPAPEAQLMAGRWRAGMRKAEAQASKKTNSQQVSQLPRCRNRRRDNIWRDTRRLKDGKR